MPQERCEIRFCWPLKGASRAVNRSLTATHPVRRIGLISPYSGGNLGNAAIISATITNIRKRIPGVEIVGITLNPDDTRRRHGIQAFPLAGVSRPHYGLFTSDGSHARQQQARAISRIKQWVKQIPLLGRVLRAIRNCGMELAHVAAAARVVSGLDQVIIPGGGALDESWGGPLGHPWTLFKWSLLSRAYGVPLLFVSVGKSSLERPLSRFFVRIALSLAEYRSYRDDESKIAVQNLIDARNDPVYPDLAFSYPRPIVQTSVGFGSQNARLLVGVSPIAYCDPRAWPRKDERRYAAYVSQLAEMVKWLLEQRHQIVFFTTDSPDAAVVDDIRVMISGSPINAGAIRVLPSSTERSVDGFLKDIARVDLAIASRLHGVILPHLNAIPVLAISFDLKVDAYMNAMGQKDYCLSIDHLECERLIRRFDTLKSARERERDHLRSAALRIHRALDLQYDRILGATYCRPMLLEDQNQIDAFRRSDVGSSYAK
jgi:polysaccharide pyruvyl transferase WcaK-like protein